MSVFRDRFALRSIAGKIYSLIAVAILFQLCTVAYQLNEYRDGIWSQRRHELQNLAAVARSIVETEFAVAKAGKQTTEVAQANARTRIGALRYNKDDYFWINDMTPVMVMHPIKPEMNGQDLQTYKDPTGKRLFVSFVDTVKAGGAGFVDYKWPKPGAAEPVSKLSYVTEFSPWGWIIGTGVYVDDLEALFMGRLINTGAIVLSLMLISAVISALLGRKISWSIRTMSDTMGTLASGSLDVSIDDDTGATELDAMARALQVFKRNSLDKLRLEDDARSQQALSESARQKAAADGIAQERERVATSFGMVTTRPSRFLAAKIWQTRRLAPSLRPAARSSMSSSASAISGSFLKKAASTYTWHVLQAVSPPHAPSMSILFACATSSIESPIGASTVTREPSGFTNVTLMGAPPAPFFLPAAEAAAGAVASARAQRRSGDAAA